MDEVDATRTISALSEQLVDDTDYSHFEPGQARQIANASSRLVDTARSMARLSTRIDDPQLAAELQEQIRAMLFEVRSISRSIIPIARHIAGNR